MNSPHKGPVTRKMLPSDDVIMALPDVSNTILIAGNTSAVCSITMATAVFVPALYDGSGCESTFANSVKSQVNYNRRMPHEMCTLFCCVLFCCGFAIRLFCFIPLIYTRFHVNSQHGTGKTSSDYLSASDIILKLRLKSC